MTDEKIKLRIASGEASRLLRLLADGLDRDTVVFQDREFPMAPPISVKAVFKRKSAGFSINLKLSTNAFTEAEAVPSAGKSSQAAVSEPENDKGSYRHLKKSMAARFKNIQDILNRGEAPSPVMVDSFCSDCRQMTSFQGKGDEHYPEFNRLAEELKQAAEDDDRIRVAEAVSALGDMKNKCHKAYKQLQNPR